MPIDNGGQIRFMTGNLLKTGVASVTLSSEDSDFPYSNATTNYRSRPFKFTGRFEVTASNNKIYFNDGSNKTATIAVGEYTTRALMASAIQTALNAVSSGWIVTWNSVVRSFSFTGPAHVFQLSNQTNAAWDMIGFTSITDTASGTIRTATEPRLHYPYEFIKVDFGYHPDVGFFGLIADSTKALTISPMANVYLEANNIDDFTAPPVSIQLTRTDRGIFQFLDDDDYLHRFWRLRIEDNFAEEEIEVGYLYLGEFGKFSQHYNDQGAQVSDEDRSEIGQSESGQVYAYQKASQRVFENISLTALGPDDKDFLTDIFKRHGMREPFFVSIDPKLEITNNLDDTTFFCRFDDTPSFRHVVGNLYSTNFKLREWL